MSTTDTSPALPPQTFQCPQCRAALPFGLAACSTCGIRLTGPLAARLWQVDQQVARLSAEAVALRQRLLLPPDEAELAEVAQVQHTQQAQQGAQTAWSAQVPTPQPAPRPALSGQQILLGLGALLLLSGLAFFVAVVWFLVGIVGQAAIMVALTGVAATAAVFATRKRLPAAAETAAVIASGLVVIDLWAAHGLGLAGLDSLPGDLYWTGAGLVGGALLLGFDSFVPRRDDAGPLPKVSVYRPAALLLALWSTWSGFVAADLTMVAGSAGLLVVAAVSLAFGWFAVRLDGGTPRTLRWLVWPAAASALVALAGHLVIAVGVGYDDNSAAQRYTAMGLLLVLPALLLAARRHPWVVARPGLMTRLGLLVLIGAAAALGIAVMELPRTVVAVVAVVLGAVLTVLAVRGEDGEDDLAEPARTMGWGGLFTWVGRLSLLALFFFCYLLAEEGAESGLDLVAWTHEAGLAPWWLPALPAFALLVPTVVSAVRRDSVLLTLAAHVVGLLGLLVALRDAESIVWVVVGLVVSVLLVALGALSRMAALDGRSEATEVIALVSAVLAATVAFAASLDHTALTQACVLVGVGAALLAYAALPGRLVVAYPGALAVTVGIALVLAERGVGAIEAYTGPAVVLLACIGAVQWWRDHAAPTLLTMAPALAVALLPSLGVALVDGPLVRLVAVTVLSLVVLLVGLKWRWQGPVVVGAVALIWLALDQGGPIVEYVDGWILLIGSGAALLAAGVLWERSIAAGRRTVAWFSALQ
ncbi:SCO7613 C-terminal domain-containing membrane protein [Nocardioides gilvus]|uniref:SCO7613 C-terminal domain-containing membrane protein n=1 Tax=Nocardioides gilvus TaxID=1735589 RepID=UPI000D7479A2|nr:DUF2157 domain-containing protein [Nocardioides gilvus]